MWSSVELREIRVFLTLAEELHFGRTAERLNLTPSRVSQTVRTLEARVGAPLFARSSRRVQLTPLGEQLREWMGPAYERMAQAFEEARQAAAGVGGALRIGTYMPANYGRHFPEIVRTFEHRHPRCRVVTTATGFSDPVAWLRRGALDLLAIRLPVSDDDVAIGPILSRESRIALVARHHPLAGRDSLSIEDLAGCPLPYSSKLPRELIDAFVPPRTPSGRCLQRVEFPIETLADVPVLVATGKLVHLTVPSFLDHYTNPEIVGIPVHDLPTTETALVWLTAREHAKIRALRSRRPTLWLCMNHALVALNRQARPSSGTPGEPLRL